MNQTLNLSFSKFPKNIGSKLVAVLLSLLILTPLSAKDYLIKNATVHTSTEKGTLENTDVYISDGFIMEVGAGLKINSKHTVIDATGKHLTPGLINAWSQIGLEEISAAESTVDHTTTVAEHGASFDVSPAINIKSTLIAHNRINGLTRTIVAPTGGETLFQGLGFSLVLLSEYTEPVRPAAQFARYGEEGANIAGGSRASAYLFLDTALQEADYLRNNRNQYLPGHNWRFSISIQDLDALKPVLEKKIPLVISVNRSSDILAMINIAKKYKIRLVVNGGAEAWMVANELALANVAVIIDPLDNLPSSFESLAIKFEGATILNEAGVKLMFTNRSSHNAYLVRQSAGIAVAYGMSAADAIKAMSINTAEVFGIENYGKIELGMEADVVIWDGDPLEVTTNTDAVFIKGIEQPMVSRATRLKDRFWDLSKNENKAFTR